MESRRSQWDKRNWIVLAVGVPVCLACTSLFDHWYKAEMTGWFKALTMPVEPPTEMWPTILLILNTIANQFIFTYVLPVYLALKAVKLPFVWAVMPGICLVAYHMTVTLLASRSLFFHALRDVTFNCHYLFDYSVGPAMVGYGLRSYRDSKRGQNKPAESDASLATPASWPPSPRG